MFGLERLFKKTKCPACHPATRMYEDEIKPCKACKKKFGFFRFHLQDSGKTIIIVTLPGNYHKV